MARSNYYLALGISLLALLIASVGSVTSYKAATAACNTAKKGNLFLANRVRLTTDHLGTKKGAGYVYYKTHPDELKIAKADGYKLANDLENHGC